MSIQSRVRGGEGAGRLLWSGRGLLSLPPYARRALHGCRVSPCGDGCGDGCGLSPLRTHTGRARCGVRSASEPLPPSLLLSTRAHSADAPFRLTSRSKALPLASSRGASARHLHRAIDPPGPTPTTSLNTKPTGQRGSVGGGRPEGGGRCPAPSRGGSRSSSFTRRGSEASCDRAMCLHTHGIMMRSASPAANVRLMRGLLLMQSLSGTA